MSPSSSCIERAAARRAASRRWIAERPEFGDAHGYLALVERVAPSLDQARDGAQLHAVRVLGPQPQQARDIEVRESGVGESRFDVGDEDGVGAEQRRHDERRVELGRAPIADRERRGANHARHHGDRVRHRALRDAQKLFSISRSLREAAIASPFGSLTWIFATGKSSVRCAAQRPTTRR